MSKRKATRERNEESLSPELELAAQALAAAKSMPAIVQIMHPLSPEARNLLHWQLHLAMERFLP